MDPKNFQTPLNSDLILFPTCKNTYDKCEQSGANSCISNEQESHYLFPQRNLRPTNSTWITNSNFLLYLIWYFWHQDIKFKKSVKKNLPKRELQLWEIA